MNTIVKPLVRAAAGVVMLLVLTVPGAEALVVKSAALSGGVVTVSGGQAARFAPISWEGTVVTTSNKGGGFAFTTAMAPSDCIGTLSDGASTIDVVISGCGDVVVSPLPPTGQIISYADRDDGYFNSRRPLSYTDNGDGTVTDNYTGLVWEKKTDQTVNEVYNWFGALGYAAALNTMNGGAGFAGHNDWRLPNVRELQSIVDFTRSDPPIDPIFGPTKGRLNFVAFWTATSCAVGGDLCAWSVDFEAMGGMIAFGKSSALRVRAVCGGR